MDGFDQSPLLQMLYYLIESLVIRKKYIVMIRISFIHSKTGNGLDIRKYNAMDATTGPHTSSERISEIDAKFNVQFKIVPNLQFIQWIHRQKALS